jgi:hypothetical protein
MRLPRSLLALALTGCAVVGAGSDDATAPIDASPLDAAPFDAARDFDAGAPLVRGLERTAQVEQATAGPHLGDVVIAGPVAYIANSWDAFATYAIEPDGSIFATLLRPADWRGTRCTTLAVHAASRSLYCASDEGPTIRSYDLSDPEQPVLRDVGTMAGPMNDEPIRASDLHVAGDWLYVARFDRGLWAAPIAADGSLGALVPTGVVDRVRFVDGDPELFALSTDRGLLRLSGSGVSVAVAEALPLSGAPQSLSVRGARAAIALGSEGAVVVDLGTPMEVVAEVGPSAVATSADLSADALVVTALTGIYLYDLSASPPRLAGFQRAGRADDGDHGVFLSGRFATDGTFLASDWTMVERFRVEPSGHALEVDLVHGVYAPEAVDLDLPFRNEGDVMLDVTVTARTSTSIRVGPGETGRLTIEADRWRALLVSEGTRTLRVRTHMGARTLSLSELAVEARPATPTSTTRPARGDALPEFQFVEEGVVRSAPMDSPTVLIFYARDCAAMWPVLTDAAYLASNGALEGGATPLLLTESDIATDGYAAQWDLLRPGTRMGHHGYLAPPEVIAHNGGERLYEDRFQNTGLPRAASHPTNYGVDASGTVLWVETAYRGAHPLR